MTTRIIHVVRCSDPNDSSNYIDVEVTDGWVFTGPNGDQQTLDCPAASAVPGTTRVSHFVTITNPADSSQSFKAEVLDGCVVTFWNGDQKAQQWPGANAVSVVLNAGSFPSVTLAEGGIAGGAPPGTRVGEFTQVTSNGVQTSFDDSQSSYIIAEKCQGICFTGPNGDQFTLDFPDADEITFDTTQYVTGPDGNPAPPPNTDPNSYIQFTGGGLNTGNALVRMGPLWRIINASGGLWALISVQSIAGSENVAPNFSLSVTNGSLNDQKDFTTSFTLYMTGTVSNVIVPSGVSLDPDPIATILPSEEVAESLVATLNEFRAAIVAAFTEVGPNLWSNAETFSFSQTVFGGNDCFGSITITTETLAAGSFIQASSSDQLAGTAMSVAGIQPAVLQLWLLSMSPKAGDKADVAVDNGTGSSVITASLFKTTKPSLPNSVPGGGCPTGVPGGYNTVTVTANEPSTWEFSLVASDPPSPPTGQLTQIG